MMYKRLLPKQAQRGFTLMEIMLVMVIIGILVTIVGGNFANSQKRSRDVRRKQDMKAIANSLEQYYNDKNRYPLDTDNGGDMEGCGAGDVLPCAWGAVMQDANATIYINILPKDPTNNRTYYYDSDATGTYYQVYARLEVTEDAEVPKSGGNPQAYVGTNCGGVLCNYGVTSPATQLTTNHALQTE